MVEHSLRRIFRKVDDFKQHILARTRANLRFLLILFVSVIEVILNIGRTFRGDSFLYLSYAYSFLGEGGWISRYVVTRPMVPFLASTLSLIFRDFYFSFGLVSGFFWISGAIIAYKIGQLILKEKDLATAIGLSYTTAPALLLTGAAVLTDSAGFFFIGLTIYLTFKREQTVAVSSKEYFLDALICCIGILFRETVVFALLFMFSRRLIKRKGIREFLLAIFLVGVTELLYLHLRGFDASVFLYKYSSAPVSRSLAAYASNFALAFGTSIPAPKPYFNSTSFWLWTVLTIVYGTFVLIGFLLSSRKRDLWVTMFFLFPSSIIWPDMSLRFSFCMWPAILLAAVNGAYLAFSKLPLPKKRIISNPKTYIFFLVLLMGVINTVNVLLQYPSLTIVL